jgi:hypothetical protein
MGLGEQFGMVSLLPKLMVNQLFHTYVQWHAIAFILGEICARPHSDILERGWRAVDASFNGWDDAVKHSKNGMLWAPMRRLMAKARKKREDDMQARQNSAVSNYQPGTPASSTSGTFAAVPTYGEFPAATANYFSEEDLDPIRPLQPGLPPETQWNDMLPQTNNSGLDDFMPTQSQQQMQTQLQAQFQQHNHQPGRPWILDDSALLDLDMNGVDNIEGWDDMANYFQMELDPMLPPDARGTAFGGGLGSWL